MRDLIASARLIFAIVAFLTIPSVGRAGVLYRYTGHTFTYTDPTLGGPWVGQHLTAIVEIANPVGDQRVGNGCSAALPCAAPLVSWSLTAGPWVITDSTPTVDDVTPFFVVLSPDASTIVDWGLAAFIPQPPDPFGHYLETSHGSPGGVDLVFQWGGTLAKAGPNDPGTWERLATQPIPEPADLALFPLGFAWLTLRRRWPHRQRRRPTFAIR